MNEIAKRENGLAVYNLSNDGLELFKKTVLTLSQITGKSEKFIAESAIKGKSLGLDPYNAYNAFWDIQDTAIEKADVIMGLVIKKAGILPFKKIKDAAYVYYYIDGGIEELNRINSEYNKYLITIKERAKPVLKEGEKAPLSYEEFCIKILKLNLRDESNPDLTTEIKTNIRVIVPTGLERPSTIYERITTLEGTRIYQDGRVDVRQYSWKLSSGIALGLYYDKNDKIKKNWNDLSKMMRIRCMKDLCFELAPDICYPFTSDIALIDKAEGFDSVINIEE